MGDAESLTSLDALITQSVLREPIVRVKIWDRTGRIVYSDAAIGVTDRTQAALWAERNGLLPPS